MSSKGSIIGGQKLKEVGHGRDFGLSGRWSFRRLSGAEAKIRFPETKWLLRRLWRCL